MINLQVFRLIGASGVGGSLLTKGVLRVTTLTHNLSESKQNNLSLLMEIRLRVTYQRWIFSDYCTFL